MTTELSDNALNAAAKFQRPAQRANSIDGLTDWMTSAEAATYLGVNTKTLEFWRAAGNVGLKYAKLGRFVRYRRAWLDDWAEARSVTSTAEAKAKCLK